MSEKDRQYFGNNIHKFELIFTIFEHQIPCVNIAICKNSVLTISYQQGTSGTLDFLELHYVRKKDPPPIFLPASSVKCSIVYDFWHKSSSVILYYNPIQTFK